MKKLPKTHRFSFEKATLGLAKEGFSVACVYKTIWQKYKDSILQKSIPDVGIFIRGGCALLPRSQFGSENFRCPYTLKVHLLRLYLRLAKQSENISPVVAGNVRYCVLCETWTSSFLKLHGYSMFSVYGDYADCDSLISRECLHYWFNFFASCSASDALLFSKKDCLSR